MKKALIFSIIFLFLVLPLSFAKEIEYAPGQLVLKVKDLNQGTPERIQEILNKEVLEVRQLFPEKNYGIALEIGLNRIFLVTVDRNTNILRLTRQLKNHPSLDYIEPNYIYEGALMPTDNYFCRQWNFHNTGITCATPPSPGGIADADIDAPEAWDIEMGDSNVKIAVLDTGVHIIHPDLQDNIWINPNEIPSNGIDDDDNGFIDDVNGWDFVADTSSMIGTSAECHAQEDCSVEDPNVSDAQGHGTHISGIASAVTNNGAGVAGVCPNCEIIPVRTCYMDVGIGTSCSGDHIVGGIVYATDIGANILSMSMASPSIYSPMTDALSYATTQNVILIAAAGNDNWATQMYPAADSNTLAVAATDWSDARAPYSNYGSWIDVAAPGGKDVSWGKIFSTDHNVFSAVLYSFKYGTSMATPHVSGLAGLILSRYQGLTKAQTDHIIKNSVDTITTDQPIGSGRINAFKAMSNWICSDSTILKQCSTTQPQFCDFDASFNLILRDNCSQCGCSAGYSCDPSGSCLVIPGPSTGSSPLMFKADPSALTPIIQL